MQQTKLYTAIRALAVFGILLAVYLLIEQWMPADAFRPCTINSTVNCDAIISGPVARVLGVPTPLFGLVGYIGILIAAVIAKPKWVMGIATGGLAFCLWIFYREIFELRVVCPVCILCQLDMISTFILGILINKKPKSVAIS